jgi:hypothetical protein
VKKEPEDEESWEEDQQEAVAVKEEPEDEEDEEDQPEIVSVMMLQNPKTKKPWPPHWPDWVWREQKIPREPPKDRYGRPYFFVNQNCFPDEWFYGDGFRPCETCRVRPPPRAAPPTSLSLLLCCNSIGNGCWSVSRLALNRNLIAIVAIVVQCCSVVIVCRGRSSWIGHGCGRHDCCRAMCRRPAKILPRQAQVQELFLRELQAHGKSVLVRLRLGIPQRPPRLAASGHNQCQQFRFCSVNQTCPKAAAPRLLLSAGLIDIRLRRPPAGFQQSSVDDDNLRLERRPLRAKGVGVAAAPLKPSQLETV